MDQEIDWKLLKCFIEVYEAGSLAAAAARLNVKHTTVSRHINDLELDLGLTLFQRNANGCIPTDAAESLMSYARSMKDAAEQFGKHARMQTSADTGSITIGVPDGLAIVMITPHLADFHAKHPNLKIKLECGLWLPKEGPLAPDVALTYTRPNNPNVVAKAICHIHYCMFAAQSYIDTHGLPQKPGEIASHIFIDHLAQRQQRDNWSEQTNALAVLMDPQIVSNSSAVTLDLLRRGVGINAGPSFLVDHFDELVPLPTGQLTKPAPLYICTDKTVTKAARVVLVKEWLESLFDPKTNQWLREQFVDPYEVWKTRAPKVTPIRAVKTQVD